MFDEMMEIKFELEPGAKMPVKGYPYDAGYDLFFYSAENAPAEFPLVIDTGVRILLPPGYVGFIMPRSSVNAAGYCCPVGVIDAGYTGTIKVCMWDYALINSDEMDVCLVPDVPYGIGDRVAQLIIMQLPDVRLVPGNVKRAITARGSNGFGSTGA